MSEKQAKLTGLPSIVGGLFLAAWIVGAAILGLKNIYIQKQQCIKEEGFLKGWLWCSTETNLSITSNMIRGLAWPIDALQSLEKNNDSQ